MAKEGGKRYETAQTLAADIRRYLNGEPIVARPPGPVARVFKWIQRRPARAAVIALLIIVLGLGAAGAGAAWLWQDAEEARADERKARGEAEHALAGEQDARKQLQKALIKETDASRLLNKALTGERTALQQLQSAVAREAAAKAEVSRLDYVNRIQLAHSKSSKSDFHQVASAQALLLGCPAHLRAWEWHYVKGICDKKLRILDHRDDKLIRRLQDKTDKQEVESVDDWPGWSVAFSPDGRRLAGAAGYTLKMWDLITGTEVPNFATQQSQDVRKLAFSPDGKLLAGFGSFGRIRVWDSESGKTLHSFSGLLDSAFWVPGLEFGRDGKTLYAWGYGMRAWDLNTGKHKQVVPSSITRIDAAFSPDGQLVICTLKSSDLITFRKQHSDKEFTPIKDAKGMHGAFLSRDGKWLATFAHILSDNYDHLRVWDCATGLEKYLLRNVPAHFT